MSQQTSREATYSTNNVLSQHLRDVDETYFEHMRHAGSFGFSMIGGGLACLVHALLPFACVTTGSDVIRRLHDRMVVNRLKPGAPGASK